MNPNDGRSDGGFRDYLSNPSRWRRFDPDLFDGLQALLGSSPEPTVKSIQGTSLLGSANYYSELVPDRADARTTWAEGLVKQAARNELIFLDPDNGLEVRSRPFGRKYSSKYAFWHEVERLWDPQKAEENLKKHGVDFREAATVFDDTLSMTFPDEGHSVGERRFLIIGVSARGRMIVVSHTEVSTDTIRIISARSTTRHEPTFYEESNSSAN